MLCLSVALGKVITNPSLCSSALREHGLEIIMEDKCALEVSAGKKSIKVFPPCFNHDFVSSER